MVAIAIAIAPPLLGLKGINWLGWLPALFKRKLVCEIPLAEELTGGFPGSEVTIAALPREMAQGQTSAMPPMAELWSPSLRPPSPPRAAPHQTG